MSASSGARIEDRKYRFMQGFDKDRQQKSKEDKEVELRKQARQDQSSQRRNIPSMERDWVQVSELYKANYTLADLTDLMQAAHSTDDSQLLYAAQGFRKLLSVSVNTPIQEVIDTGIVPRFLEWTQRFDFSQLQYEACWILTNISAGNSHQTNSIIEKGAVHMLVKLLSSANETVREQAVWALGNIAGDNSSCRDLILHCNGLNLVTQVGLASDRPSMHKNVYWTTSNLCRGKPPPQFSLIREALPILSKVIQNETSPDLLSDCLYSIASISEGNEEKIQAVIDTGVVAKVIELLNHFTHVVQMPALKIVGNIAQGSEEQTQHIIDLGVVPGIFSLLTSAKRNIQKEAVWTCSNISAGNKQQLQALYESNVFPRIVQLMIDADIEIKKECVWSICNAASASTPQQIAMLVQANAIDGLCRILKIQSSTLLGLSDIFLVVLQGLRIILECGRVHFSEGNTNPFVILVEESGGLKALEDLQGHTNPNVYEKALTLLETYFELEEDENENLLKAIKQCTQYNF
mmetsp:Transcript_26294/g.47117  ORF Transcript_26294/g.47117 Transcript_26294/m.47117 type:complete len:520 (-) Transcript_26294:3032-4591(-)